VLNKGTERHLALAEMGQPAVTENDKDERKFDTFAFFQVSTARCKPKRGRGGLKESDFASFSLTGFVDKLSVVVLLAVAEGLKMGRDEWGKGGRVYKFQLKNAALRFAFQPQQAPRQDRRVALASP
jgi:hypothetical protein